MDNFTTFNTGNRKKFLEKTKKKKEDNSSIKINSQQEKNVLKVQNNIRAFLCLRTNTIFSQFTPFCMMKIEQFVACDQNILIRQLRAIKDQNTFLFYRLQKTLISLLTQFLSKQGKNNLLQNFSKILQTLGEYVHLISQIFDKLSRRQKQFWTKYILPLGSHFSFNNITPKQKDTLCEIIMLKVQNFMTVIGSVQKNSNLCQQIIFLCFKERNFPEINRQDQFWNCSQNTLTQIYSNLIHFLRDKHLPQLGQNPTYILNVFQILLEELIKKCRYEMMRVYKIDQVYLRTEEDFVKEVLSEKQEWVNFIQFLQLDCQFFRSVLEWFVGRGVGEFQNCLAVCGFVTVFVPLIPNEFQFSVTFQQLVNVLSYIDNWVRAHEIGYNVKQQKIFLSLLIIMNETFFRMTNLQFVQFAKQQGNFFMKVLKDRLIKIIYKVITLKQVSNLIDMIHKQSVELLSQIYNKIFRTKVFPTDIFVNESLTQSLKSKSQQSKQFLLNFPFVFSLKTRARIFREKVMEDFKGDWLYYNKEERAVLRRGYEFDDAFNQLKNKDLRRRFKIVFVNIFGEEEIGVDAGGLTKEFLDRVLKAAFKPEFGMFLQNSKKQLLPHPQKSYIQEGITAECYEFIGKLIGRALFQGITIGPQFCGPFLNAIIGKRNNFDDLQEIDLDLYKSLVYIKTMKQDVRDLELTFQYIDQNTKKVVNLKRNGSKIPVTNENKNEYIALLTNYKVNRLLQYQSRFIRKGLKKIINSQLLFMFNYAELNYLISGSGEIKVYELRQYTKYTGYAPNSVSILMFWSIVEEFDQAERSKLLQFVTACPRPSFLGFEDLNPPFTIIKTPNANNLPVSHTCSNMLELPDYQNRQIMKDKLLKAINSESGFDLA